METELARAKRELCLKPCSGWGCSLRLWQHPSRSFPSQSHKGGTGVTTCVYDPVDCSRYPVCLDDGSWRIMHGKASSRITDKTRWRRLGSCPSWGPDHSSFVWILSGVQIPRKKILLWCRIPSISFFVGSLKTKPNKRNLIFKVPLQLQSITVWIFKISLTFNSPYKVFFISRNSKSLASWKLILVPSKSSFIFQQF